MADNKYRIKSGPRSKSVSAQQRQPDTSTHLPEIPIYELAALNVANEFTSDKYPNLNPIKLEEHNKNLTSDFLQKQREASADPKRKFLPLMPQSNAITEHSNTRTASTNAINHNQAHNKELKEQVSIIKQLNRKSKNYSESTQMGMQKVLTNFVDEKNRAQESIQTGLVSHAQRDYRANTDPRTTTTAAHLRNANNNTNQLFSTQTHMNTESTELNNDFPDTNKRSHSIPVKRAQHNDKFNLFSQPNKQVIPKKTSFQSSQNRPQNRSLEPSNQNDMFHTQPISEKRNKHQLDAINLQPNQKTMNTPTPLIRSTNNRPYTLNNQGAVHPEFKKYTTNIDTTSHNNEPSQSQTDNMTRNFKSNFSFTKNKSGPTNH